MTLSWHGILADGQGYSGTAGEYAVALSQAGLDVNILTPSSKKGVNFANASPAVREILEKPFKKGEFGIAHGLPHLFSDLVKMDYKHKIGFTMFETTKIPEAEIWGGKGGAISNINKLDAMFTPSNYCKELFEREGVNIPIKVIHNGVNLDRFPLMKRDPNRPFTFLILGTLTHRKNPGAVLSAFMELFAGRADVHLIVKTQSGTLGAFTTPYPNIEIIDRLSTHEEVLELYQRADCFLFPTRGEGFGLPPLEAMATGIPAIVPWHSGFKEYADEDDTFIIKKNWTIKAERFPTKWGDVGHYWDPDYREFRELMFQAYYNRDETREMGKRAAERIRRDFSYQKIAGDIIKALEDIRNGS